METNLVKTFVHEEFGRIRTVIINNKIHFVGKDVATALGYVDTKSAIQDHVDAKDKFLLQKRHCATLNIPNRGLMMINESGLFSLILESDLPRARAFRHWVTAVVLPTLRATGNFTMNETVATLEPPLESLPLAKKIEVLLVCVKLTQPGRLRNKFLRELLFLTTGK